MIPETKDLRLMFLELSSKRKLIGYVDPAVAASFETAAPTAGWFKLYHPVEAHVHMVTRDFFEAAELRYPGAGVLHMMNRDLQVRQQLEANAMGDSSPLIRYYNDMRDRGPMWRLYYVYLAGCDYAKPAEPMVNVQWGLVEVMFPYKEESDQQLKMLYDVEIRGIDKSLLPELPQQLPEVPQSFRGLPVHPGAIMPAQVDIPVQFLGGNPGDPRYDLPKMPQEAKQ